MHEDWSITKIKILNLYFKKSKCKKNGGGRVLPDMPCEY
jgi:hypothetical protein